MSINVFFYSFYSEAVWTNLCYKTKLFGIILLVAKQHYNIFYLVCLVSFFTL